MTDGETPIVDPVGDSVFRWALGSIASRMGETLPRVQPVVGKGSFAQTKQASFLTLPVSSSILKKMDELNANLAKRVEPTKTEQWFPQLTVSSDQQKVFSTRPTRAEGYLTAPPSEDTLLGALRKQTAPVWSAYVRKARLQQWQNAAHQLLGQLSLMENLTKFVGDLLDESAMIATEREQVRGALAVLQSTLISSARLDTSLCAHLDLTVRDAELRLLEINPFQQATFRSSPLFLTELFGGITRATVEDITASRMMSDIHSLAEKRVPTGQPSSSKGKKSAPKATAQPSRLVQPFRGQAAVPQGNQQPGTGKKAGKGGKGKNKSKR